MATLSRPAEQDWLQACRLLAVKDPEVKLQTHRPYSRKVFRLDYMEPRVPRYCDRTNWWSDNLRLRTYINSSQEAHLKKLLTPSYDDDLTKDFEDDLGLDLLFGGINYLEFGS